MMRRASKDTDAWYFDEVTYALPEQWAWLNADLAAVDRTKTPWLAMMGHRPMYCSASSISGSMVSGTDTGATAVGWGDHLGWPVTSTAHPFIYIFLVGGLTRGTRMPTTP